MVSSTPTQTIYLGPGDSRELVFDNLKQPELTIAKVDADDPSIKIPDTVFRIIGIDNDYRSDVTTGKDGTVKLRLVPGSYKIVEMAVPARTICRTRMPTGSRPYPSTQGMKRR